MEGDLRKRSLHIGRFQRFRALLTPTSLELFPPRRGQDPTLLDDGTTSPPGRLSFPLLPQTVVGDITIESVRGNYGQLHKDQFLLRISFGGDSSTKGDQVFSCSTREEAEKWKLAVEAAVVKLSAPPSILRTRSSSSPSLSPTKRQVTLPTPVAAPSSSTVSAVKREKQKLLREELKREASQTVPLHRLLTETSVPTASPPTGAVTNPGMTTHLNAIHKAKWKEVLVTNGLRVLAEVGLTREAPCLRLSCRLNASPERAFQLLYNYSKRALWDSVVESAVVVSQEEDGHLRTMHCKLRSIPVNGVPMAPRDYIVDSTWRRDDDGSYIILETANKTLTRFEKRYVRAQVYALGVTLSPPLRDGSEGGDVCWLQMAVHADPGGWLAKLPLFWGQQWLCAYLLTVVGLKEVLDEANFRTVDFNQLQAKEEEEEESMVPKVLSPSSSSSSSITPTSKPREKFVGNLEFNRQVFNCTTPWNLRSATYLRNKIKESCAVSMFTLIAMDLLEFHSGKMEHITENYPEGIAYRHVQDKSLPFLFVVQFQVPPNYSLVSYFEAKPGAMDEGTKFAKLFSSFANGSDAERDNRFKFIPRMVKGNFVVKSAMGQTPTLIGNKLVTTYHSGANYFEVDVDVGSSSVAGGILSVCKSYANLLTIDMGFLLEAKTEEELPEVMLGALSFQGLNMSLAQKV
ncbi:hypothetical protein BASA81_000286 [Batrachochytrium salamandrivorans]|nr:hypothetical protein BASA81_000286 [Batrachochytrium salamandrivorans]